MNLIRSGVVLALVVSALPHFACSSSGSMDAASSPSSESFEIDVELITAEGSACERTLGAPGSGTRVVTADEAKHLVDAVSSACGIVSDPRISVGAGGMASIDRSMNTDYVQDYDADARPIMGHVEYGVHIFATPKSTADDKTEVALSIEVSGLHMPMRRHDLTLPGSAKIVTVQLPEVEVQKITTSVVLGEDETAVVPIGPTPGDDPMRAVVMRVHRRV